MIQQLKETIEWGTWEFASEQWTDFCGRFYFQDKDGSIKVNMEKYTNDIKIYKIPKGVDLAAIMNNAEQGVYRSIQGQLSWLVRLLRFERAFSTSVGSSKLGKATYQDLKEANKVVKDLQATSTVTMIFRNNVSLRDCAVIGVGDSAFDNMPGHKSQKGRFILLGPPEMLDDHEKLHPIQMLGWTSSRFGRVVRSTLSAEAYQNSDTIDDIDWTRAVLSELFDVNFQIKKYN